VVIYDRSCGDDARKAFEALAQRNVPAVLLKGGFLAWEAEGFDIERSQPLD
jgi:3-mercaptopyruvate sulfurtransferase SseA